MDKITKDTFAGQENKTFTLKVNPEKTVDLKLTEVQVQELADNDPRKGSDEFRQPFTVVFQGPKGEDAPGQGVYEIENEKVGKLSLLVVPIGETDDATEYQVVFC